MGDDRTGDVKAMTAALVNVEENHLDPDCVADACDHPDGECPEYAIRCRDGAELLAELRNEGWAIVPADTLDDAWAEAEAALPEGWRIDGLYRTVSRTSLDIEWEVVVHEADWQGDEDSHAERGPTPAAALRALAAKLREAAS